MTNEEKFWKARNEYYAEPDEPDLVECPECNGTGDDVDCEGERKDCEECGGTGEAYEQEE